MLTHPALNVTLAEIESDWSYDTLTIAHEVLDGIDEAQRPPRESPLHK